MQIKTRVTKFLKVLFAAMFTSEMKETFIEDINLHGVSATGLEKILEFIYSGNVLLSLENIQEILAAASYLQVSAIMDFCKVGSIVTVLFE